MIGFKGRGVRECHKQQPGRRCLPAVSELSIMFLQSSSLFFFSLKKLQTITVMMSSTENDNFHATPAWQRAAPHLVSATCKQASQFIILLQRSPLGPCRYLGVSFSALGTLPPPCSECWLVAGWGVREEMVSSLTPHAVSHAGWLLSRHHLLWIFSTT